MSGLSLVKRSGSPEVSATAALIRACTQTFCLLAGGVRTIFLMRTLFKKPGNLYRRFPECWPRGRELTGGDKPWNPRRFESGDKVADNIDFDVQGNILFPKGTHEEVFKLIKDSEEIQYPAAFMVEPCRYLSQRTGSTHHEWFNEPENWYEHVYNVCPDRSLYFVKSVSDAI